MSARTRRSQPALAQRRRLVAALTGGLGMGAARLAFAQPDALASSGRRLALVVGNGAYRTAPLKNPINDAQAVAGQLKALGFEVMLHGDTGLRELIEAMRRFSVRAPDFAVRLVFYAGHGIQVKGRNYLLPVDTDIQGEDEVPGKSADVNELLDRLGQIRQGVNIVILDACRSNPFAGGSVIGSDGRKIRYRGATPSGLAAVAVPLGTMVAFSTAPGGVALDSANEKNSVYVKHLLSNLRTPGMPVELLFKQVRLGVAGETARAQVPWESSSLTGEFCFRPRDNGTCSGMAGS